MVKIDCDNENENNFIVTINTLKLVRIYYLVPGD